jgi:hypothetical protein
MRLTNKYISKSMEFLCRELSRCLTASKEQGSVVIEGVFKKNGVSVYNTWVYIYDIKRRWVQ